MYRSLDAALIVETAGRLRRRIEERFPGSGLGRVAAELEGVTLETAQLSRWLATPDRPLRYGVGLVIAVLVSMLIVLFARIPLEMRGSDWSETFQGLEALVNDAVFVGVAIYFMLGVETRRKRRRALTALQVLRSMAHIVDMHQLTKDPERIATPERDTSSSPKRSLSPFELARYLDYSTELLAIVSKVAALYVQEFDDPVTVGAASAIEDLSVNLSRTIWQKIVILDRTLATENALAGNDPS
ncbi:MAG TPA: hypothetical protein VHM70_15455 [Polyangiaceae bacterium]|jgi:hypothetical protein|nr:hypothetical protein [Polyangiaceae bacterium]